ncbi:MAG TPA: FeoB small GTPase domain-containing protein [Fimbriimonadales bacterium]|nr:FeoB small GTPase domain-containing protein [Fimbriimonadales bacterium]
MTKRIEEFGLKLNGFDFLVGLAGNPNTGKSTLFNALTGLRQHTGNWPGKTVTRAEGSFRFKEKKFKLVDLPGTYSLYAPTEHEAIVRDFLLYGAPDATIVVMDATNIERNLNLTLQILEITGKVVIALNLVDEAERKGIEVNHQQLSKDLSIPVVPCIATRKKGLEELADAVYKIASKEIITKPRPPKISEELKSAVEQLLPFVREALPGISNPEWIALRLLDSDAKLDEELANGRLALLTKSLTKEARS